jgi:hypothetical protein
MGGKMVARAARKDIAPNLFRTARFKRRFVHTKLHDFNWIRNLKEIDSPLLEEHIILYMALSTASLAEHKDQIVWRWTKKIGNIQWLHHMSVNLKEL